MTIKRKMDNEQVQEIFESVLLAVTEELGYHDVYYDETHNGFTNTIEVTDAVSDKKLFTVTLEME